MFETMHPAPPQATARDLATYHAHRERFYGMSATMLAVAPDHAALTALRRRIDRTGAAEAELMAARSARSEFDRLFAGPSPSIDIRCPEPSDPTRIAALLQTGLGVSQDIPGELRVLAILADRTATAIESGDIADAATVSDIQIRFLRQHAAACIQSLAQQLITADLPFYASLGRALVTQLDEDMRLLTH
jgi:hypothetical protein